MKQQLTKEEFAKEPIEIRIKWQEWASKHDYPPRPNIGTMIEFLDERERFCWNIEAEAKIKEVRFWNIYRLGGYKEEDEYIVEHVGDLCDALWQPIKEILNET